MSTRPTNLIPEVFVLWHPQCRLGEKLAKGIYTWLRPGNGVGPQVFYRSLPAPDAPPFGLPPPLPGETRSGAVAGTSTKSQISYFQILLPLIDEHMVADAAWRYWLNELSWAPPQQRVILPVALDPTAYNLPGELRKLNYLRPVGVPLVDDNPTEAAVENVARSLLKQLTEALCRLLLNPSRESGRRARQMPATAEAPKITLFLSHAKVDGTGPARRLRDYIYSQTQLAAFYDENDIAYGSAFSRVIQDDLQSPDTAALIVVRSDQYASRPWCRRELSLFRRPRPLSGTPNHWQLFPTLVVEAMEGRERSAGIPELGNSPLLRWNDDKKELEELIVTTVIRDAMLGAYHAALGASIPSTKQRIVINWLPDPTTLLHIFAQRPVRGAVDVVHPGRGLSGLELDILFEFFPQVTFRSFEEVLA